MENLNQTETIPKQRHGCVTTWLILMILANSLTAILYFFSGDTVAQNFPGDISQTDILILGALGTANVIFCLLIFKWKKIGFWGFFATGIAALAINLSIGLSIGQSLIGLAGIAVLYAVLQIKRNDVTAWNNLD